MSIFNLHSKALRITICILHLIISDDLCFAITAHVSIDIYFLFWLQNSPLLLLNVYIQKYYLFAHLHLWEDVAVMKELPFLYLCPSSHPSVLEGVLALTANLILLLPVSYS